MIEFDTFIQTDRSAGISDFGIKIHGYCADGLASNEWHGIIAPFCRIILKC